MCNPGGAAAILGITEEMQQLYPGVTLSNFEERMGRELGVVRISLGLASNFHDVWRVIKFAECISQELSLQVLWRQWIENQKSEEEKNQWSLICISRRATYPSRKVTCMIFHVEGGNICTLFCKLFDMDIEQIRYHWTGRFAKVVIRHKSRQIRHGNSPGSSVFLLGCQFDEQRKLVTFFDLTLDCRCHYETGFPSYHLRFWSQRKFEVVDEFDKEGLQLQHGEPPSNARTKDKRKVYFSLRIQ